MGWELLQYLLYSPDLAPGDFSFFGPHNKSLGDIKFKNDKGIQRHASINFDMMPIKNLMLQVPADL